MLIAVGMYLPLETTFAIFVGGMMKGAADKLAQRRLDPDQRTVFDNVGILLASGFIAGEALTGVLIAGLVLLGMGSLTEVLFGVDGLPFVDGPVGGWLALAVFAVVALVLIRVPMKAARRRSTEAE